MFFATGFTGRARHRDRLWAVKRPHCNMLQGDVASFRYCRGMKARRVSLGWELGELERAVEAVRILCGQLGEGGLGTRQDLARAPLAAAAVLALIVERLRLVRRVIHGWAPTALLVAPHNEVEEGEGSVRGEDLILPVERKVRKSGRRRTSPAAGAVSSDAKEVSTSAERR